MAAGKILLVGSSEMELLVNVARLPDPDEFVKDEGGIAYAPGGASNAAIAFARLGASVIFATRIGADIYGQKLYSYYKEAGIDTSFVKVDRDLATSCSLRINEADGASRVVGFAGASENISPDAVSEAFAASPGAVFISFEPSFDTARRVARIAEARRLPIFINAVPASANHPLDALPQSELFILAERDVVRYTGIKPVSSQDSLHAAFALGKKVKARYIVIDQGQRGAVIYDGKRREIVTPIASDRVLDAAAAQETFAAALCTEYLRGGDIKAAARYAVAAEAIASSRYGAATSVPADAEVRALLAKPRY